MTKAELVAQMAKAAGGTKSSADRAMHAFVVAVFESLRKGRRVTISGFGTFCVSKRAARNGRNPRTGKAITIPSAKVPRFKPSRSLKTAIR
jgi:DNA-binding protein HU-beta